jgi:ribosome-associated toxin RatA of RatAB toxin-antitoxin module
MAKAERTEVFPVSKDALFKVITDYESYPEFVENIVEAKIEKRSAKGVRVRYKVSMFKDFEYTIELHENKKAGTVTWSLLESDVFELNNGSWKLTAKGAGACEAVYSAEAEFKVPVPGFVLKKLIQGSLPSMMKAFAERAGAKG